MEKKLYTVKSELRDCRAGTSSDSRRIIITFSEEEAERAAITEAEARKAAGELVNPERQNTLDKIVIPEYRLIEVYEWTVENYDGETDAEKVYANSNASKPFSAHAPGDFRLSIDLKHIREVPSND